MKVRFSALPFLVCLWLTVAPAAAAPGASCASKFVGSWMVRVDATGQTYPSQILANGRTHVTCPMCTPGGSWTCSGNTITVNVDNGVTTQHTLHADGRTMSGGCCTITRVGSSPPVLSSDSKQPSAKQQLPSGLTKDLHTKIDQGKSTRAANTAQPAAPPNPVYPKSASCSDITGTGSGSSPSNCAPSSSVPGSIQAQIGQAQSYTRAAQTVKQSDPSYNGWTTAAGLYRKAAAAFQLAGDLAQAHAASDQAQTLENGLKIANQMAAQPQSALSAAAPDPAPGAILNADNGSSNSFNIPTPCQDLTGKYGCQNGGAVSLPQQPGLAEGKTQRLNKPRPWIPGSVAPDVQVEIAALAETILGRPDDALDRAKLVRALERRLADHRVPVQPKDIVCLQPVNGVGQRLLDISLRWHPEHIKKEAIDRSHLCDGVADGDAKENCRENNYGRAVMWAEPELAGQCRSAGGPDHDVDAVAECAKRKFLNAWANNDGIVTAPPPDNWTMPAMCNATVPPAQRKQTLRDRLRAALAAAATGQGNDSDDDGPTKEGTTVVGNAPALPPPSPPAADDDEAYCNYMAREVVRGELTPNASTEIPPGCKATIAAASTLKTKQQAGGAQPFSMNADETDKEIQRLLGQKAAESRSK